MRHSCDRAFKRNQLKPLSHEHRISLRMTNEYHLYLLASVDLSKMRFMCPFDHLTGHSSLGNLRCMCVLHFFFVNVIRFSCVIKVIRFSCVGLYGTVRHLCDRALKAMSHKCRMGQRMRNEWRLMHEKRMTLTKKKNNTHKQRRMMNVQSMDQITTR